MNRRDFLKGLVAISATGAVVLSNPVAAILKTEKEGFSLLVEKSFSSDDIIIDQVEIVDKYDGFGQVCRGMAYLREKPEGKKYFAFEITDEEAGLEKKFIQNVNYRLRHALGLSDNNY